MCNHIEINSIDKKVEIKLELLVENPSLVFIV